MGQLGMIYIEWEISVYPICLAIGSLRSTVMSTNSRQRQ